MLLQIMSVVFLAFLVIGLGLPVLPIHVHQELGFGTFIVGLVTGSQFVASLLSRVWAGHISDQKGGKTGVVIGLLAASASGLLYLLSLALPGSPSVSMIILLLGRGLLGAAESLVITGGIAWGLALGGIGKAGKVIAWIGMAMFAAMALGAPIGTAIYHRGGFVWVALATALLPIFTLLSVACMRAAAPPVTRDPAAFLSVLRAVWIPGIAAAMSSLGFGAILAFSSLLFVDQGWSPVWLAFTAYAVALILARLLMGNLPDRLGGAQVALFCIAIEAAGLGLMWFAREPILVAVGAALTGAGYALVYPGLGIEAVRRASAQMRGLAMGIYTAFLDVTLGIGTPALGLVASATNIQSVFFASAIIVLGSIPITISLRRSRR